MRLPFTVILLFTIFFAGTYWYTQVEAVCALPISYRVGDVDERFDLSFEAARIAITDAESVWENATGRNLFVYDEEGDVAINFVFDERQREANNAENFRERLDATQNVTDAIDETYETLVAKYESLDSVYQEKASAYQTRLDAYNTEVAAYNEQGGAPKEAYDALQEEKEALDSELRKLNALSGELQGFIGEINSIGDKRNKLVETYNSNVSTYNDRFHSSEEFTQGDYQGEDITIYTFTDGTELRRVLAHELGHAMGLEHVTDATSVMFYLMEEQSDDLQLTQDDLEEFYRVCGKEPLSFIDKSKRVLGI